MALSHAILVTLLDKPQTGYDLGKRFDQTVGFFWRASHQQIYSELHKMANCGWVSGQAVEQSARPNRIVYEITEAGRQTVQAWAREDSPAPSVKEELLVKLFALGTVDKKVMVERIEHRLEEHRGRLVHYREVMAKHYPKPDKLTANRRGRYLGLRMGILSEETGIRWCEEALLALS
mgnify:FL=1|tara:strand:+ start:22402 stop:22932 length:531 start_codon:yes stop_codon:yes gene_type:complete